MTLPGFWFAAPLALLLCVWTIVLWRRDDSVLSHIRRFVSLAVRLGILAALVLALAGATLVRPVDRQAVIFVVDVSASMAAVQNGENMFVQRALSVRGRDDVVGVVVVGGDALVERGVGTLDAISPFESIVDRSATNLDAGLTLADALFPIGYRKRVVLLTDGRQTTGDAVTAARLLAAENVRVDVVSLSSALGAEASVVAVQAPSAVHGGERLPLSVTIGSTVAQTGALSIIDDARVLERVPITLSVGVTRVTTSLPPLTTGFHRFQVVLDVPNDTITRNNEGQAITNVKGSPRVLVAEGSPGEGDVVAASLRPRHIIVVRESAALIQASPQYLSAFDAVVLVDVPAVELDPALLDPGSSPLKAYVDGGGGLVIVGGPRSYGVGGYSDTALDALSPVSMKLPQRVDTPSVAVALIVENLETDTNVNTSKVAAEGVVKLLTPLDQVEVDNAAGTDEFDNGWSVPLQYVRNKQEIARAIDAMQPVDPMSYRPSLTTALTTLSHASAKIKHIILVGDGDAVDNYQPLIARIRAAGITVSTVATGAGTGGPTDYGVMKDIARWGKGTYYQADNAAMIPQIFLKETKQIARTGLVEAPFMPEVVSSSPILNGVPGVGLGGYVATTPKAAGEVVLAHFTRHGLDPVLAQWQYGLGRVAAWTSDAQGRWTALLISTPGGSALWSNLVSWVLPADSSANLSFSSTLDGTTAHLRLVTSNQPYTARATARIDGPTQSSVVALQETAPGVYEGDARTPSVGAYLIGLRVSNGGRTSSMLRTGLVVPYSAEYRDLGLNLPVVHTMASAGGGGVLPLKSANLSFAHNLPEVDAATALSPWLLVFALLLLPIDVAARRLLVSPAEVMAMLTTLVRRSRRPSVRTTTPSPVLSPLSTLREQRTSRHERPAPGGATVEASRPLSGLPFTAAFPTHPVVPPSAPSGFPSSASLTTPSPEPRPAVEKAEPEKKVVPTDEGGTAGRLLDAKRRNRRP